MFSLATLSPFNSIALRHATRLVGTHHPRRSRRLYLNHLVYVPPVHTVNKPGPSDPAWKKRDTPSHCGDFDLRYGLIDCEKSNALGVRCLSTIANEKIF
jgi:hypothetical protein